MIVANTMHQAVGMLSVSAVQGHWWTDA